LLESLIMEDNPLHRIEVTTGVFVDQAVVITDHGNVADPSVGLTAEEKRQAFDRYRE
jgi:hypothetical protein